MTKKSCISDNYLKCDRFDRHCVGQQWTNFVYELGKTQIFCSVLIYHFLGIFFRDTVTSSKNIVSDWTRAVRIKQIVPQLSPATVLRHLNLIRHSSETSNNFLKSDPSDFPKQDGIQILHSQMLFPNVHDQWPVNC